MAGFINSIMYAESGNLSQGAAAQWWFLSDGTDSFGYYNSHGSPEGVVLANIGSLCTDTSNGNLYIKQSDSVKSGWVLLSMAISSVDSLQGTQHQVLVNGTYGSPQVGVLTLTLPQSIDTTSSPTFASLTLTSPLTLANGGTSSNLTASNGGIFYSTASRWSDTRRTATANQILMSGSSTTPTWSTATYPIDAAQYDLIYASSTHVWGRLATADNGILITSNSGVPSWLANGIAGYVLTANSSAPPSWQSLASSAVISITATAPLTANGTSGSAQVGAVTIALTNPLPLTNGGTNASLIASNGGIFYSTASAGAILAGTITANQILMSGVSSAPAWSTATYPATTTINQLLYSSSANTISGLSTANNGVLITSSGGVPSISSTLPIAVQTNITELGTVTVGTWNASLIPLAYGGTNANLTASNGGIVYSTASAFAILAGTATANQMLMSGASTTPIWTTSTWPTDAAQYDILYATAAHAWGRLATANDGVLITSNSGVPSWLANSATPGYVLTANSGAPPSWQALSGSAVTSITATAPLTANATSGSPQTGAVTIALTTPITLALGGTNANLTASNGGIFYSTASAGAILAGTATANQILMSGSSTTPAWSSATYPASTTINQLLYSSSANVITGLATSNNGVLITSAGGVPSISSTLPSAVQGNITSLGTITSGVWQGTSIAQNHGGTGGSFTYTANGPIVQNSAGTNFIGLSAGLTGQLFQSGGASSSPGWTVPTYPGASNTAGTILISDGTNINYSSIAYMATIAQYSTIYASASNTLTTLANGTTGQYYAATHSGAPSASTPPNYHDAVFIVGSGSSANYTTIASAITAAVAAGETRQYLFKMVRTQRIRHFPRELI